MLYGYDSMVVINNGRTSQVQVRLKSVKPGTEGLVHTQGICESEDSLEAVIQAVMNAHPFKNWRLERFSQSRNFKIRKGKPRRSTGTAWVQIQVGEPHRGKIYGSFSNCQNIETAVVLALIKALNNALVNEGLEQVETATLAV